MCLNVRDVDVKPRDVRMLKSCFADDRLEVLQGLQRVRLQRRHGLVDDGIIGERRRARR